MLLPLSRIVEMMEECATNGLRRTDRVTSERKARKARRCDHAARAEVWGTKLKAKRGNGNRTSIKQLETIHKLAHRGDFVDRLHQMHLKHVFHEELHNYRKCKFGTTQIIFCHKLARILDGQK